MCGGGGGGVWRPERKRARFPPDPEFQVFVESSTCSTMLEIRTLVLMFVQHELLTHESSFCPLSFLEGRMGGWAGSHALQARLKGVETENDLEFLILLHLPPKSGFLILPALPYSVYVVPETEPRTF